MAWAQEIPGSGRWRGLYRDAAGRQQTAPGGPFRTKAEAERRAGAEEDDARRRPGRVDPKAGHSTWGAWADQWWPRRTVEPGTLTRDASRRVTHLDPRWRKVRLDHINREAVQDWVNELVAAGIAPATVANIYHLLSASLKAAVLAGKLPASPCVSITLPTRPPADEVYLTWDQVAAITHFMSPDSARLVWFLVGTGTRWGEAVGAHRHRLHLDARRLDVHEVWDQRTREVKPYPKGRAKRSVPLPSWLHDKLADLPDPAGRCGSRHRRGSNCRSQLILPGRDGVVLDYDSWRRNHWEKVVGRWWWYTPDGERFRSASAARKVVGGDVPLERRWAGALVDVGPVTIHDCRHTYASWLIQDGVSIEALSDLLGHSSIAVTMRYAHLASSQWDSVRAALESRGATHSLQSITDVSSEDRPAS